jgi:hypothetical protein
MIVSVDSDRHSGQTLYIVFSVRTDVKEFRQERAELRVNCLAVYRDTTLRLFMHSCKCVYNQR